MHARRAHCQLAYMMSACHRLLTGAADIGAVLLLTQPLASAARLLTEPVLLLTWNACAADIDCRSLDKRP